MRMVHVNLNKGQSSQTNEKGKRREQKAVGKKKIKKLCGEELVIGNDVYIQGKRWIR